MRFFSDSRGHLKLDPAQIAPGRGAYVCPEASCIDKAVRSGGFARSLRRNIARVTAEALIKSSHEELEAYSQGLRCATLEDGRVVLSNRGHRAPAQGVKVLDEQLELRSGLDLQSVGELKKS